MSRTYFFWDPLSDNILQERDESGTATAEYTTEPGLYGNLISQNRGGVERQYHFDSQGSTLALTDDNQQTTDTYAYTAFGEVTEQNGSMVNPFQYIGQKGYYWDAGTGEYHVRRRLLSSLRAKWLSVETSCEVTIVTVNAPYVYCSNSPTELIDPSGLVEVVLDPDKSDSMPWHKGTVGKGVGDFGITRTRIACNTTLRNMCSEWKVLYTLSLSQTIWLDIDKIVIGARKNKKLTRKSAYGHEQRHVDNYISILMRLKATLDSAEVEEYESKEAAEAAAQKYCNKFIEDFKAAAALELAHKGLAPKSPGKFELPGLIGEMPEDPVSE